MVKIGRNDPCSCGSQKKYKKCCQINKFTIIEDTEISDKLKYIIEYLQNLNPNLSYVNITNQLNVKSYQQLQLKILNTNIVMIAEKTSINQLVFFDKEESSDTDILIMYHGGYRSMISTKISLYNLLNFLK